MDLLLTKIKSQGALRLILQAAAVLVIFILPFAEPGWHPKGADIFLGAVIPAIAPILFILLMLDVMMCAIWKADSQIEAEVLRFGFAIKAHLFVGGLLILFWINSFSEALFG